MAYAKKYFYTFKDLNNASHSIELWQDTTGSLTAEEVRASIPPFTVEMPGVDKFTPVRGTGCEVNLISTSNMKFFNSLYHINPKEYIIKHNIDSAIDWVGYANSELFRESYTELTNYDFQLTGNDGLSLTDRYYFVNDDGSHFSGIKSLFEILNIILTKIGLPYGKTKIALATTFAEFTNNAESSLLHEVYIDCANFYNEDNEPETMRKVLESILQPFAAFITIYKNEIYIVDTHTVSTEATASFKCFQSSSYTDTQLIPNVKDISIIGYNGTGQQIEVLSGANKQVVRYSPYPIGTLIPELLTDLSEVTGSIPGNYSVRDNDYLYKVLTGHKNMTVYSPAQLEYSYRTGGTKNKESIDDSCICLTYKCGATQNKIASIDLNPYINISAPITGSNPIKSVNIKIDGEVEFFRHWGGSNYGEATTVQLTGMLRVGNKLATLNGWFDYPHDPIYYTTINSTQRDNEDISQTWIPFGYEGASVTLPVDIDVNGQFYFDLYGGFTYIDSNQTLWDNTNVHNAQVRIRKLNVTITDSLTNKEINDDDIEYYTTPNPEFKNAGELVSLLCGTDARLTDRGKLMKYNSSVYSSINEFTRNNQTYKIEHLLLNSLTSNKQQGAYKLTSMNLFNTFSPVNILTNTDYLGSKTFMVAGYTNDYADNTMECSLVELMPDSNTIEVYE